MKKFSKISIIILNWNGWRDTLECLESVFSLDYQNFEVILVDNFSTNDSISRIEDWIDGKEQVSSSYFETTLCTHQIDLFKYTKKELEDKAYLQRKEDFLSSSKNKQLFLLQNDKNYGFAGGCNIPMRQVIDEGESDYVFLLNNDVFIEPKFLSELMNKIPIAPSNDIGCAIGSIYSYGEEKYWIKEYGSISHGVKKVDKLTGCGLLISTRALEQLGSFDEYFFLYCEDYDLTLRVSNYFDNFLLNTESKIYHKVEGSSSKIHFLKIIYQVRNTIILYSRFYKKLTFSNTIFMLVIVLKNNMKINIFKTLLAFFTGVLHGLYQACFNKGPKY